MRLSWRQARALTLTGVCTFCSSGLIFGLSSLYPILYAEAAFTGGCNDGTGLTDCQGLSSAGEKCCENQLVAIAAVSTAAFFGSDVAIVIYGEVADRLGPRVCFAVAASLSVLGLLLAATAALLASDLLWTASFVLMGLGGPGTFIATLSFTERWRSLSAIFTTVTAATFDSSSLVYLIFNATYFGYGLPLPLIALGWAGLVTATALPMYRLLPSQKELGELRTHRKLSGEQPGGAGDSSTVAFLGAPQRVDLLMLIGFIAVYNLKSTYYIVSFSDMQRRLFSQARAQELDLAFHLAFPLGAFACAFVAAITLHTAQNQPHIYIGLCLLLANVFSFLSCSANFESQLLGALLFGAARTSQWAAYFHFLTATLPPERLGRVLGYGGLFIALLSDGTPNLLNAYVLRARWPLTVHERYLAVHIALAVPIALSVALPIYLRSRSYRDRISGGRLSQRLLHRTDAGANTI